MRSHVTVLLLASLFGCSDPTTPETQAPPAATADAPPRIDTITPSETKAGTAFNRQPDGSSALSVNGAGFDTGAVITANGEKLTTAFGNPGWVTAVVPAKFYGQAGRVAIQVTNASGATSNTVDFEVKP